MMPNFTPQMLFNLIKGGATPQQAIMNCFQDEISSNPMMANLMNLAQQGKTKEIEKIARNLLASRGLDYDKEFNAFQQMLGR